MATKSRRGSKQDQAKSNGHASRFTNDASGAVSPTISSYLIQRLLDYKVRHLFGVPGDYVLTFYQQLQNSPIEVIGTTAENCAGFAADAYARVRGMGAVCITYCVGGLNLVNPIAGAYAEKSAVVVISGAPGERERRNDALIHHKVRTFTTQLEIFEKLTCASTVLDDPRTALHEIDRVLEACWRQKRPVYIELPRDMVDVRPPHLHLPAAPITKTNADALGEALQEAAAMIRASKNPVILADVEVHRFGLQKQLVELVERSGIPVAATILGKSVISEKHPLYLGIYEGAMGRREVQQAVENSDCVIMLGTFLTDINLGIFTAKLDRRKTIEITSNKVQVHHHYYEGIAFTDFLQALLRADLRNGRRDAPPQTRPVPPKTAAKSGDRVTVRSLFQRLDQFLSDDMMVICDVGDCLFGAVDLTIHKRTEFLASAYYTSMGFAVPAALGAQVANPNHRALVLVGDGAFQMTGQELSTMVRLKLDPIVVVLNNHGYTTERFILDGPFNDITEWNYDQIHRLLGAGMGFVVKTVGDLDKALAAALRNTKSFSILNVHLDKLDHSQALHRLGEHLANKLKGKR
ncbi:MAG: alpha-keto acid decarboxylase family protein [Verrucomicrobiae bacterium]|nr:alpha-keto acid decarboxylase family protein [Verrucomicrobiae bacterium]